MTISPEDNNTEQDIPLQVGDRVLITHTIPAGLFDTHNSPYTNKTGVVEGFWEKRRMDGSKVCEMVRVSLDNEDGKTISFNEKYIERIVEGKETDNNP